MDRTISEAPLEQLPSSLRQLLAFERFNLHKPDWFIDRSRDPAFDTRYLPHHAGVIELPCYWIERRHLYVFGRQQSVYNEPGLMAGQGPRDHVLFPIHPTSVAYYAELLTKLKARDAASDGLRLWAAPTASIRTFLAWPDGAPDQALFVKTSLHSKIVGDRRLYRWKVARSVGLSTLVHESLESLPASLSYFPETLGLAPRQMPDSGVIVRSIPPELKSNQLLVAPLFALMGGGAAALFVTLIERERVRPLEFLEQVLCDRFARLWLEMALRSGLILEAHGQDLMMTLSPDLAPLSRFYYRDFEGMQVDWELRRGLGLSMPGDMPNAQAWHETYATWGYRYGHLLWFKLKTSLFQYLRLVLLELGLMLREWRQNGLMRGVELTENDLTAMFSRRMTKALDDLFGVHAGAEQALDRSLNQFVLFLLRLRKDLLGSYTAALP